MIIATFNANSLRSRLEVVLPWLKANQPDILAIQETKVQDADFPLDAFDDSEYKIVYRGQKKYNGVAILSKESMSEIVSHFPADDSDQARFLTAKIGPLTILNTYVPQGMAVDSEKFEYKLNWFRWLREYMEEHYTPQDQLLWVGDLNVARSNLDVHDPERLWGHVCFCEPVQKALVEVMEWGWVDVFRHFYPEEPDHYTFWDYRAGNAFKNNRGWRIDYIMATKPLMKSCKRCWVDRAPRGWNKPSDHTFLLAEFDIG